MIQPAQSSKRPLWLTLLGLAALVLTVVGAYLALFPSPPDVNQGELIRIMYAHVPVAWIGFVAVGISAIWGMLYLWRGRPVDDVSCQGADAALLFAAHRHRRHDLQQTHPQHLLDVGRRSPSPP